MNINKSGKTTTVKVGSTTYKFSDGKCTLLGKEITSKQAASILSSLEEMETSAKSLSDSADNLTAWVNEVLGEANISTSPMLNEVKQITKTYTGEK